MVRRSRRFGRSALAILAVLVVVASACGTDEQPPAGRALSSTAPPTDTRATDSSDTSVDTGTDASPDPQTTATTSPAVPTTSAPTTTTTTTAPAPPDRPPALPADPVAVAARLVEAERAVRDPATPPSELAEQAHVAQYAYRMLAAQPEHDAAVRAVVPPDLLAAFDANIAARRELRGMHTHLLETLPTWRIVDPIPYDELVGYYQEAEAEFGVPWEYLAAVHLVETAVGRVDGLSVAGAQGPMQFMPGTWEAFGDGGDVHDHRDAILGAARYLAANNGAQDIDHALFRYNRSQRYVRAIKLYAALIAEHPATWRGLYHWGVWYLSDAGEVYLPVGYHATEPIPAAEHLASLGR